MRPSRAELERRVDELAEVYSGRAFADAMRSYSDGLDEEARVELQGILLLRARAFEDAARERAEAKGWLRRTFDRMDGRSRP